MEFGDYSSYYSLQIFSLIDGSGHTQKKICLIIKKKLFKNRGGEGRRRSRHYTNTVRPSPFDFLRIGMAKVYLRKKEKSIYRSAGVGMRIEERLADVPRTNRRTDGRAAPRRESSGSGGRSGARILSLSRRRRRRAPQ